VRIDDFKYRFTDQPRPGATVKVDGPILTNLRLEPYERTGMTGSLAYHNCFAYGFWRFVFVKKQLAQAAQKSSNSLRGKKTQALICNQ
jgi:arylsulfatase